MQSKQLIPTQTQSKIQTNNRKIQPNQSHKLKTNQTTITNTK